MRRRSNRLWALMLAAILVGCPGGDRPAAEGEAGTDTLTVADTARTGAVVPGGCSAAGLDPVLAPQPGLPPAVARIRSEIAAAAVACDYARLEALALAGQPGFRTSFGNGADPADYWARLEAAGEEPLRMLVRTLTLPHARESYDPGDPAIYVWPSVHAADPAEADWRALEGLYTAEEIAGFRELGGFLGWRVGIADDGDWLFFVAGD